MTSIHVISDTHLHSIPAILGSRKADILIHCGDALNAGTWGDWQIFVQDLKDVRSQYDYVYFVPGNHDKIVEEYESLCRADLEKIGVEMLIDQHKINHEHKIHFYGSPWVCKINGRWGFESLDDAEFDIGGRFSNIPTKETTKLRAGEDSTYFLITHSPPYMILDNPEHYGSKQLVDRTLKCNPDFHVFGHTHRDGNRHINFNGIKFYNAAICTEVYLPLNLITEIEI